MTGSRTDPRLLELFLDLVRIDAVSGRERPAADYVRGVLGGLGLTVEEGALKDEAGEPGEAASGNLVCPVAGGGEVAVVAHLDTVLSTAGLDPLVENGRVSARGAPILGADNRAGVAAILRAVERLVEGGSPPPFTAAFTVREETDLAGARSLVLPESVKMVVVFDSSLAPGSFIRRAFGARWFRVEVTGRAAHAALAPERGVHAVQVAARALADLPMGRVESDTTLNVGRMSGGTALNVVPEVCVVEGEIRSLRRERVDSWLAAVDGVFRRSADAAGAEVEVTSAWEFEPFELPEDAAVCRRIAAAMHRQGLVPRAETSPGGSDANALNARGIPAVNVGIGAQNPHSRDELILLEDLETVADLVAEVATGEGVGAAAGEGAA